MEFGSWNPPLYEPDVPRIINIPSLKEDWVATQGQIQPDSRISNVECNYSQPLNSFPTNENQPINNQLGDEEEFEDSSSSTEAEDENDSVLKEVNEVKDRGGNELRLEENCQEKVKIKNTSSESVVVVKPISNDNNGNMLKCGVCEYNCRLESSLKLHMTVHQGAKECEVCGKHFARSIHLKTHINIHTGEKPFDCKQCDKSFADKSNLLRHNKLHTGNNKCWFCGICNKGFRDNSHLRTHLRSHTGFKPYKCDICGKQYTVNRNFKKHKCDFDTKPRPHTCDFCGKGFSRKWTLKKHQLKIHGRLN